MKICSRTFLSTLVLLAAHARAAKLTSWQSALASSPGLSRVFTIFHGQACHGTPYTKNETTGCDGWTGLTQDDCEMKCKNHEQAPHCPKDTCHASVFYPASGMCQLFKSCKVVEPSLGSVTLMDQEMMAEEQAEERLELQEDSEPSAISELMTSMPIVLLNLTNMSTSMRNKGLPPSNRTSHKFGVSLAEDMEMFYDKASGFLDALHEVMGAEGPKYCPKRAGSRIKACISIATCLIQRAVPQEVGMTAYSMLMEQVSRFEETGWPMLKSSLLEEGRGLETIHQDEEIPEEYICDGAEVADPHSLVVPQLLQTEVTMTSTEHAETLAFSARVNQATARTHRILDAHDAAQNASMEATASQLRSLWHSICQKLVCDAGNMFDVFQASHKQSLSLLETNAVAHLHHGIRQRTLLYSRLQRFVAEHRDDSFFRHKTTSGSEDVAKRYMSLGRAAIMNHILPYVKKVARTNQARAVRLLDQVELAKFSERLDMMREQDAEDEEDEEQDDEEEAEASVEEPQSAHDDVQGDTQSEMADQEESDEESEGRSLLSMGQNATASVASASGCAGRRIALWNRKIDRYVRMWDDSKVQRGAKGWRDPFPDDYYAEYLYCMDAGNGGVAFYSMGIHRFLQMTEHGISASGHHSLERPAKDPWWWPRVRFEIKDMGGGLVALWHPGQKRFLNMNSNDVVTTVKRNDRNDIPNWWDTAKFFFQDLGPVKTTSEAAAWCKGKVWVFWNRDRDHYMRMSDSKVERGHKGWRSEHPDDFPYSWTKERFQCVDAGNGNVAFHNGAYQRYLRMDANGRMGRSAVAGASQYHHGWVGETFKLTAMGRNEYAIYNPDQKKFMKMDGKGDIRTSDERRGVWDIPPDWRKERFYLQRVRFTASGSFRYQHQTIALWNHANQHYVSMNKDSMEKSPQGGWKPDFPGRWTWERFVPVMAGAGEVAFHNTKWNRFLRMNEKGRMDTSEPRQADLLSPKMTWERFRIMDLEDDRIALYNVAQKRFMRMGPNDNGLHATAVREFNNPPNDQQWTKFYVQVVGEAVKKCGFWCKLKRFVKNLLKCLGQWSVFESVGYGRDINSIVGLGFGTSTSVGSEGLLGIFKGEFPPVTLSIEGGIGVGIASKFHWAGVAAGVSFSVSPCQKTSNLCSASFGFSLGIGGAVICPAFGCPLGNWLGPFECGRSLGASVTLICCSVDLFTGTHDCA